MARKKDLLHPKVFVLLVASLVMAMGIEKLATQYLGNNGFLMVIVGASLIVVAKYLR